MKRILFNSVFCFTFLFTLSVKAQHVKGFHHIESVVSDGKFLYVADIGSTMKPLDKDGDGKIVKLSLDGKILDSSFVKEKLNAPKGLAVHNGTLYLSDIDWLVAVNLNTGKKAWELNFTKDAGFLNDISVLNDSVLFLSATDKSVIFKVNTHLKSYAVFTCDQSIPGVNGLVADAKANRLYVNGFGGDKPTGIIGYIDLTTHAFTRISTLEGHYDGLVMDGNTLFVSDWLDFKTGIVKKIDIATGKSSDVIGSAVSGPADFILVNNELFLPAMLEGTLYRISVK